MEFTLEELCIKLEWNNEKFIAIDEGKGLYPEYADEILETHGHLKVHDFYIAGDVLVVLLGKREKEDVWDFED